MVSRMVAGRLESLLIPGRHAEGMIHEVLAHPFTAGELVAQSRLGVLRVNGREARATVEDVMGTGDYLIRIIVAEPPVRLEAVA